MKKLMNLLKNNREITKEDLIDKYIIVGFTYLNKLGEMESRFQLHGIIRDIQGDTIFIRQKGGEEFTIPFEVRAISRAESGSYNLKSTGELIESPDFLSSWTIRREK